MNTPTHNYAENQHQDKQPTQHHIKPQTCHLAPANTNTPTINTQYKFHRAFHTTIQLKHMILLTLY